MDVLQNRLDSFAKQRRNKLRWPHPKTWKATPETLSEAGFFFDPSNEDPDNVTCFMCGKQVTEWADDDDPFDIHWRKCGQVCAWASLRCGLSHDMDSQNRFVFPDKSRLPTSKAMEKTRLQTFSGWKHDKNKKHMATSKKMAHAGFVSTPTEPGDDTGTCFYCNVALGNWDEDDDPMQHHLDRDKASNPCAFLALAFDSAPSAAKPKSTKRAPKASSHTEVIFPTKTYDGSEDESAAPHPASTAKTPRKAASSSTTKTPRTTTRSVSRNTSKDRNALTEQEESSPPPPKKRSRSKSVSRRKAPEVEETEGEEEDVRAPSPTPARQRRTTTKSTTKRAPTVVDDPANLFDDDEPAPIIARKSSRKKSTVEQDEPVVRQTSRSKQKSKAVSDDEASQVKPVASTSHSRTRSKGGTRSNSRARATEDEDESSDGWFEAAVPPPPPTAKSVSRSKAKVAESGSAVISRKERNKQSDDQTAPTRRVPSRSRNTTVEPEVEPPPVQKRSRTVSKTEEGKKTARKAAKVTTTQVEEVFSEPPKSKSKPKGSGSRPPSRAKTPAPPSPVKEEDVEATEVEMEEYLPPVESVALSRARTVSHSSYGEPEIATAKTVSRPASRTETKVTAAARPSSRAKVNPPTTGTENDTKGKAPSRPPSRAKTATEAENKPKVAARAPSRAKANSPAMDDLPTSDEAARPPSRTKLSASKPSALGSRPVSRAKGVDEAVENKKRPPSRTNKPVSHKMELDEGNSVVDISDDDDEVPPPPRKPVVDQPQTTNDDDVEMAEVEESMNAESSPQSPPVTPPRQHPQQQEATPMRPMPEIEEAALFIPPLATDPFVNLDSLTEAELDMTVEDWVRYQMGLERERFKKDGERMLLLFEQRAEEVRRAIASL
ncbi:hypothetical protein MIND_00320400 [Mycena indigotica]|uniref:BIR-domain-containing protein n=1 Tax=Mycena indigotica TaxID=2126181 RepID=A0A8H6WAT7_9AGAR|nr:uncharacterized protein MIND_00320400 [Mycena indigotica]KAF7309496.1 hypothetical protein MIND_00320400 [Mycena indigotica]